MAQKPHACFGHIFLANILNAGEVVETNKAVDCIDVLLVAKGHLKVYDKLTGGFVDDIYPGYFVSPYNDAQHRVEVVEPSVVFCFSGRINHNYVPTLEPVLMLEGETREFPAQTKLFICEGTITVNGLGMTGPCQVKVQTAKTAKAKTDVYGVIVK